MTAFLIKEPEGFPRESIAQLKLAGPVYRADQPYPASEISVAFVRLQEKIGKAFHINHPALQWIVSPTTGVDHLDLAYFSDAGVNVICLRGRTEFLDYIHATAEHTLALVLALIRQVPPAVQDVFAGRWNRYPFKGRELYGKTVLILGYGRIGRQVHTLYSAFGCRVFAFDSLPNRVPAEIRCDLSEGLSQADLLSIHVSLDDSTRHLVNHEFLDKLKPGAWLVNTSRGEVVDQAAVLARIQNGCLSGVALDVLQGEPNPLDDPALRATINACSPRLLITPHIAGFTEESLEVVEKYVTELLLSALTQQE